MKKKIIVFLAALLGAFAMPSLQAQQIPQRQNEGVNKMNSKNSQKAVLKDLNLTATQKAEMKVLQEDGRSQMQAIQNDKTLSQQDKKAKLEALREAQTVKRNAILTPEQKAKIESQMKERQANAGKNGQRIQQGRQGINSQGRRRMSPQNTQSKNWDALNLTATQKAEMKVLQEEGRSQMQAIQNDKSLSQQDKKAKLEALREAQTVKRNTILTPEQKAKFESQLKERQANAGKNDQRIQQDRQGINSQGGRRVSPQNTQSKNWDALNLTATQKAEMEVLREEGRSQMQAIQNDKTLSQQDKKAKLEALREAQTVKRNTILTPEQQAKWNANRQTMRGRGDRNLRSKRPLPTPTNS